MASKHTTIRFSEGDLQNIRSLGVHLTKKGVYGLVSRKRGVLVTALLRYLIEQEMIREGLKEKPEHDWLDSLAAENEESEEDEE